jgi:hypothetical protein
VYVYRYVVSARPGRGEPVHAGGGGAPERDGARQWRARAGLGLSSTLSVVGGWEELSGVGGCRGELGSATFGGKRRQRLGR